MRSPIVPSGRLATSTQLPFAKLSELLTQDEPVPGFSGEFPSVCPTLYLTDWVTFPKWMDTFRIALLTESSHPSLRIAESLISPCHSDTNQYIKAQ